MKHELPKLPFAKSALEPLMSHETLEFHYGKHHKGYVDKLNTLIVGTPFENTTLEATIKYASGAIFNNAAQAWNHTFFWNSLTPEKRKPRGELLAEIESHFHSVDGLLSEFRKKALAAFGSGWVWLIEDRGHLRIETTHDGDNFVRGGERPLITCDLWEHAYYIDCRNERAKYIEGFVKMINWEFAQNNFAAAFRTAS